MGYRKFCNNDTDLFWGRKGEQLEKGRREYAVLSCFVPLSDRSVFKMPEWILIPQ
jgi:hypothetical protein